MIRFGRWANRQIGSKLHGKRIVGYRPYRAQPRAVTFVLSDGTEVNGKLPQHVRDWGEAPW